jgi:hypothetical protein
MISIFLLLKLRFDSYCISLFLLLHFRKQKEKQLTSFSNLYDQFDIKENGVYRYFSCIFFAPQSVAAKT